jgi:DNA-binding transcriptional ArsR family regulator
VIDDQQLDEVFRALAHQERRLFLSACLETARSAGDLAERSALALASVSEHLKVLRKTGLLRLEKRGRFRFYLTDRRMLKAAADAIDTLANATRADVANGS